MSYQLYKNIYLEPNKDKVTELTKNIECFDFNGAPVTGVDNCQHVLYNIIDGIKKLRNLQVLDFSMQTLGNKEIIQVKLSYEEENYHVHDGLLIYTITKDNMVSKLEIRKMDIMNDYDSDYDSDSDSDCALDSTSDSISDII